VGTLARRRRLAGALTAILIVAGSAGCGSGGDGERKAHERGAQPYRDLQGREVKAVAPERAADLLAGEGAGYALAAELNHYPGPAHALELADRLDLTPDQARSLRRIKSYVHERARPLGRRILALERRLDRAFGSARAADAEVARLTARIGALEGRLRFVHLAGHIRTTERLTRDQIARYDELRGYGDHGHSG
jgi:hypothetical protein